MPGKVAAVRHLRNRDVFVTSDCHLTKNHLEEEIGWTTVIARGA